MLSGQLAAGTRMLAKELGISRTMVRIAYDQLTAEGCQTGSIGMMGKL